MTVLDFENARTVIMYSKTHQIWTWGGSPKLESNDLLLWTILSSMRPKSKSAVFLLSTIICTDMLRCENVVFHWPGMLYHIRREKICWLLHALAAAKKTN